MEPINFYTKTKRFLEEQAFKRGVRDLSEYYELTDFKSNWFQTILSMQFEGDSEMNLVFAQLLFHSQNTSRKEKIIKFEEKLGFLRLMFYEFSIEQFIEHYCSNGDEEEQILNLVEALRYDEDRNSEGLIWDSTKSKEENKDQIVRGFARTAIRGAKYLSRFKTKNEFVCDLLNNYKGDNKRLINYFINQIGKGSGFSVALTCDFLKELDCSFDFLAKPDIHIKDVMARVLCKPDDYYYDKDFECLNEFQDLVKHINESLSETNSNPITVYQLDRMVWLICSGNFFLEEYNKYDKTKYLSYLQYDYALDDLI
ncbi:MAG: hypothetical protein E7178_04665 [Erysipelotrichaceae bacterium]|nr:hypothetical protein [Erysipelotrichaceae bacterium]